MGDPAKRRRKRAGFGKPDRQRRLGDGAFRQQFLRAFNAVRR